MIYEPSTDTIYPDVQTFKLANRMTSYGELDTEEERNIFGLFTMFDMPPAFDPDTHTIEKDKVAMVGGKYCQTYKTVEKALSHEQRVQIFCRKLEAKMKEHFNKVAAEKRYDNYESCIARAGYPSRYQKEAQAFGTWMDECNAQCYEFMNLVTVGERRIPEDIDSVIADLDKMVWPE